MLARLTVALFLLPMLATSQEGGLWELENRPGCFIAESLLPTDAVVTVSWTGPCNEGGTAFGTGTVHLVTDDATYDIPFVNGELHGTQIIRASNGTVIETPFVAGTAHGTEIARHSNGDEWVTPLVNGRIHGTAIVRQRDCCVVETPFVNGQMHGTEIRRFTDGTLEYYCYRNHAEVANKPCESEFPQFLPQ